MIPFVLLRGYLEARSQCKVHLYLNDFLAKAKFSLIFVTIQ